MSGHQRIKEYIVSSRDTYTRESITETLLKQGYSREDIDLVWQSLEKSASRASPSLQSLLYALGIYLGIALAIIFVGYVIIVGICNSL